MGISVLKVTVKYTKRIMSNLINAEFSKCKMQSMKNVNGEDVDLYVPRKCSATSRILHPQDKSSIQLNIPKVDSDGRVIPDEFEAFIAISGYVRNKGRSDLEIEKLLTAKGLFPVSD